MQARERERARERASEELEWKRRIKKSRVSVAEEQGGSISATVCTVLAGPREKTRVNRFEPINGALGHH